ncbi:metallophosphoesterase [Candidatus Woesearchaeota archaeon]|nr:metallophosphoesterase [Candidatus Woesearchaeota archaeon]
MIRLKAYAFPLLFFLGVTAASLLASLRWSGVYHVSFWTLFITLILFLVLYPVTMHVSRDGRDVAWARIPFILFSYVAGALYLFFLATLVEWLFAQPFPSLERHTAWILPAATTLLFLLALVRARTFRVKRLTLPLDGLKKPVRLVHLSDLHLGAILKKPFMTRVAAKLQGLEPDIIAVTGDVFDGTGNPSEKDLEPLASLKKPVLACLGNHDGYYGYDKSASLLERAGVTVLRNNTVKKKGVRIGGLDAPLIATRHTAIRGLSKLKKPDVLLYHMPSQPGQAERKGVKLFLAGHTHAGQLFPFWIVVRLVFRYVHGPHHIGRMLLNVSAGTGSWGPPLRLGTAPEMTVITLEPSSRP